MRRLAGATPLVALVAATILASCVTPRPPPAPPTLTHDTASPVALNRVDLHDGMIAHVGGTYYWYGTEYGCGFAWGDASKPWCGFGVSTAPALDGPWSTPTLLFDPTSWQSNCRGTGCFNPRLVQRTWSDGAFLLWFNSPGDEMRSSGAQSAYWVMTCSGPAGPCSGALKPSLGAPCGNGIGDFAIVFDGTAPWLYCTLPYQTPSQERLVPAATAGTGVGSRVLAGYTNVEGVGAYRDAGAGTWVLTVSDPSCGYCSGGVNTSWGFASAPGGNWTQGGTLSATSCAGQPRTVDIIDGTHYEHVDQWYGSVNETNANTVLSPLAQMTCPPSAAAGLPHTPGLRPYGDLYTP